MVTPKLTYVFDRKGQATKKKAGVVELRISQGAVRKYVTTGITLLPKEWSNGSVVNREDWKELNEQLQTIRKKCLGIITCMMDEGRLDLNAVPKLLKNELTQQETFMEYAEEIAQRRYRSVAPGTKRNYEVVMDFLRSWKGLTYFSDVTERTIMKMDDALSEKGLKVQTRWNYHKVVKSVVKQAVDDGLVKVNPYSRLDLKRGNENGLTRFLTPAEFHRFETCVIPVKKLQRVRDLFVFQTYTMLGYADLEAFDYKKCVEVDGQKVYRSCRVKTKQPFTIVLLRPALAVLQRYKYKLPVISNVKYNEYLKMAVLYAKIDKQVTTHWARHTGATMLVNEGKIQMHIVQHMLGHSTVRETERTYAKVLDKSIVESMADYQKKKFG